MASPEVERPMTSPSNPVLSPHALSPGPGGGSSTTSVLPSSSTSRKVVTFDQRLEPNVGDYELSAGQTGHRNRPKFGKHGHGASWGGGNQRHHLSYYHKYRGTSGPRSATVNISVGQHKTAAAATATAVQNIEEIKNVLTTSTIGEKLSTKTGGLSLGGGVGSGQPHAASFQAKRFRGGGGLRKRSYSFSEGHCKSVSSVPTIKRWKNNYHRQQNKEGIINVQERGNKSGTSTATTKAIAGVANLKAAPLVGNQNQQNKKSKFLLGGNIRDPLNLNSLSDERVSRMVNAVTPESSPIPTPKHRKAEYKIEVLIPPNISDPLNLMNADQIEGEYESQLLSPVLAAGRRKKAVDTQGQALGGTVGGGSSTGGVTTSNSGAPLSGGKKFRFRKRARSAKQQSRDSRDAKPPDIIVDSADFTSTATPPRDNTDPAIMHVGENASEQYEVNKDEAQTASPNKELIESNKERAVVKGSTNTVADDAEDEIIPEGSNKTEELTTGKKADIAVSKAQYKLPLPPKPPPPFSWKRHRKSQQQRKANLPEIVSPVMATPPQTKFGGIGPNTFLKGARQRLFHRGLKFGGQRRGSHGAKSTSNSSTANQSSKKQQFPSSPSKAGGGADSVTSQQGSAEGRTDKKKSFEYGNYNRYYGYRNIDHGNDPRLRYFNPEWFVGKDVLDIGCNVGHVTLAVAKNLNPRSILGVDIDENLIRAAKQNVKHYTSCIMPHQTPQYAATPGGMVSGQTPLNTPLYSGSCVTPSRTPNYPGWEAIEQAMAPACLAMQQPSSVPSNVEDTMGNSSNNTTNEEAEKINKNDLFPISMPILYGPIDPTNPTMVPGSVRGSEHSSRETAHGGASGHAATPSSVAAVVLPFPQNVRFSCVNYVLESDDLLDVIQPEYDTILCLSTTKWMHLNFGDDGIKRAFNRMYAQLRYGGRLVLEAQGFAGYKKRKNLTSRIRENFDNIKLRPESFRDYLIHEVAFVGETIAVPTHPSQGFQRPLQVFTKLPPMSSRSASSCQTTPYYAGSSSHGATPYYMPPSPLGMFPPRAPGRPCYAPVGQLTPMYSDNWPEAETGYGEPDTTGVNPSESSSGNTPTASGYSPSSGGLNHPSTTPTGYSPYHGSITPSQTPTGSGPPSTSNSPFGGHGSP